MRKRSVCHEIFSGSFIVFICFFVASQNKFCNLKLHNPPNHLIQLLNANSNN